MSNLTYSRLTPADADIPRFRSVHQMPQIARYLSISEAYFDYVTQTDHVFFYKVYADSQLVGSVHLETQDQLLYMDLLVFPEFQGAGLGKQILADVQNDVFHLDYGRIAVSIDEENTPSLKLFQQAGFAFVSKADELLNFVWQRGGAENRLYCLTFFSDPWDWIGSGFHIGLFSSPDDARRVALRYRSEVPGFKDYPCDYRITAIAVPGEAELPEAVYIYQGWNRDGDYEETDWVISPCFVSKDQAEAAYALAQQHCLREEWALNRHIIGQCDWAEGFVRWYPEGNSGMD